MVFSGKWCLNVRRKYYNVYIVLVGLFCIILFTNRVYAQQKPAVDDSHQRFFVHYVDQRSFWEKSLNLVGLTTSDVGRSFALIAGVTEYPNLPSQYEKLDPAKEDIRKLKNYLVNCEFFDEIVLLQNKDMNEENLKFFLQSYFPGRLKRFPKSRFLFAYSGHGFTDGEDSYLMEYTAQSFKDKVNSINVISLRVFIDEVVKSAEASDDYVLVLLNACYAGAFLKRPFGGKIFFQNMAVLTPLQRGELKSKPGTILA